MSRGLLEKALKLARWRHGVPYPKTLVKDIHPSTGVAEMGGAIKFLTLFPQDCTLSHRNATSICTLLENSAHLTPGPTFRENIKLLYFQSKKLVGSVATRPHPNFREARDWVQTEIERRVEEWVEVGVSTEDMLALVHRARRGGNQLNRDIYREIFKICLCIQDGCGDHVTPPLRSLLELVVADCGGDAARDILFSSSFQVVTSKRKLILVSKLLGRMTKSIPLVYHKEQLSASLSVDRSVESVVNVFTQYMSHSETPPSLYVYEELLSLCAQRYQLKWAINIFNSMTTKYRIAPSRSIYNILTILMTSRVTSGDDTVVTRELCHRVLTETVMAYGGIPPLWVFSEMTKPLVHLVGMEGYHTMYSKCEEALDDMSLLDHKERKDALRNVWRPSLYLTLIKAAVATDNQDLGLHMLSEMRRWGYIINSKAYILLLQLLKEPEDLHQYLPILLKGMNSDLACTPSVALELQKPLTTPLTRMLEACTSEQRALNKPAGFMEVASWGLLDAALSSSSHERCIQQLERHIMVGSDSPTELLTAAAACESAQRTTHRHHEQYEPTLQVMNM